MKNTIVFFRILLLLSFSTIHTACNSEVTVELVSDNLAMTNEVLEKFTEKKIYFAHQSIGFNILDGINDITQDINIKEINEVILNDSSFFCHSTIGENTKPFLKIDEFSNNIRDGLGDNVDIAILKLCYIDFFYMSEVDELFNHYYETYKNLEESYPEVTFIHFTVPLHSQQKGLKAIVKKILGKEVWGYDDNLRRQQFNEKIRNTYSLVFDIAEIESTRSDGSRSVHTLNGKEYYSLLPEYSNDGAHLNKKAANLVAKKLILFISELK